MQRFLKLVLAVVLCEGAGVLGAVFTFAGVRDWYPLLNKPFFTPPSWVFGPVWTTLYLLMGISLFLVWGKKKLKLNWFWVQLVFNILWSGVFFGLHSPLLGLVVIFGLWVSIFQVIKVFGSVNKTASYLLYPYLLWVSFAILLNLGILILNG